ncbi:MAG: AAA family ATPase [Deltaproteobacteria bacterium]|nr:AAA family ATPase [Deltaproteobacteria bacterium]
MPADPPPTIWVLAGPNGGGKSSLMGELLRECGGDYLNPDELTRQLMERNPGLARERANALAWADGLRRLEEAISRRQSFAFETTLGGRTISRCLHRAADLGLAIRMWYVALDSADRHVARVHARARRGGHAVAEQRIRERYLQSRANLARLIPKLTSLRVFDNSAEAKLAAGEHPRPRLVLDFADGRVLNRRRLASTPDWAKPLVAAALKAERVPGR